MEQQSFEGIDLVHGLESIERLRADRCNRYWQWCVRCHCGDTRYRPSRAQALTALRNHVNLHANRKVGNAF